MTIIKRMQDMANRMTSGDMSAPFTIYKEGEAEYNPSTGVVEKNETAVNTTAVRVSIKQFYVDGKLILGDDVEFYVNANSDDCNPVEVVSGDTVEFDNTKYVVKDVKPWNFNGVSMGYKVRGRVAT